MKEGIAVDPEKLLHSNKSNIRIQSRLVKIQKLNDPKSVMILNLNIFKFKQLCIIIKYPKVKLLQTNY